MGDQLPAIQYPGLSRAEIVDVVERFYDRYYFRPRIIFSIVRRALFKTRERQRLYKEAHAFSGSALSVKRWSPHRSADATF